MKTIWRLAIALLPAAVGIGVLPASNEDLAPGQIWLIANSSTIALYGSAASFANQGIGVRAAPVPSDWETFQDVLLPRVPLAFGQYMDAFQDGPASGVAGTDGSLTLDLPLRLVPFAAASACPCNPHPQVSRFVAHLTSEEASATTDGGQTVSRHGVRRNGSGAFVLVAVQAVPQPGMPGTHFVVTLEISGTIEPLDADADGSENFLDNCVQIANAGQSDSDGDGDGDLCDSCVPFFDPLQLDSDHDGLGDACEVDDDADSVPDAQDNCPRFANVSQADLDGDTVGDWCDNCPTLSNAQQRDCDRDGIGDVCEACPCDALGDIDGDAVCAPQDNCAFVRNPSQTDGDEDTVGDACDSCPATYDPGQWNDDSDTLGNACDNCPALANQSQHDEDGNGLGDACDPDHLAIVQIPGRSAIEWEAIVGPTSWNVYEGDLDVLRASGEYTQQPGSNPLAARHCGVSFGPVPWAGAPGLQKVVFSLVTGVTNGVEGSLGTNGAGIARPSHHPCP